MIKFGDNYFNLNAVSLLRVRRYEIYPYTYAIELRLNNGLSFTLGRYDNIEDARKDLDVFAKELVNERELKSRGIKWFAQEIVG